MQRDLKKKIILRFIYSFKFDFFNPNWHKEIKFPKEYKSAIYSFAALEQIGQEFQNLFNFIKNTIKPKIIIHLEPIAELLPQDQLLSYLSTKYFYKRNYLNGYYSFLKQKEKEGEIIIHEASRMPFGSLFIEGYSLIVWSPHKNIMKILVTGASGLIGNYLLNYLYKKFPEADFYGTTYKNIPNTNLMWFMSYSEILK